MAAPPKAVVATDRLRCTAGGTGILLAIGGSARAVGLMLPWWTWTGRAEADFWGIAPGETVQISPLEACASWEPADSGTCVQLGTMVTFVFVSCCSAWGGAIICCLIAAKLPRLALLLFSALVALGSTAVGVATILMGMQIQDEELAGLGFYLSLVSIGVDATGFIFGLWGANKATPDADSLREKGPQKTATWLEKAQSARAAADEVAKKLAAERKARMKSLKKQSSRTGGTSFQLGDPELPNFQKLIDLGTIEKKPIPPELMHAAFAEIDSDFSGKITSQELQEALETVGLKASSAAMARIMKEIDNDNSGTVEVQEFVAFFQMLEDLGNFEEEIKSRTMFFTLVCNFCFCTHLFIVAFIVMAMAREEDTTTENYNFLRQMFQLVGLMLAALFVCNVGVPMARLTLGSSIDAWCELCFQWCRERKRRRAEAKKQAKAKRRSERQSIRASAMKSPASPSGSPDTIIKPSKKSRVTLQVKPLDEESGPDSPVSASSERAILSLADKPGRPSSPSSPASPKSAWSARSVSEWSDAPSAASGMTRNTHHSTMSPLSRGSRMTFRDDDGIWERPGVYVVLHDRMAVRREFSIKSKKVCSLRKGDEVRVVEVRESFDDERVRARLEPDTEESNPEWISIRDMADDYVWAKRIGSLEGDAYDAPKRQGSILARTKTLDDFGRLVTGTRQSRRLPRLTDIKAEELGDNPAYDGYDYEDAWRLHDWDHFRAEQGVQNNSFCGTMQVQDVRTYHGGTEEFPEVKQVQGGLPNQRGEWKLAFTEK